MLRLKTSNGTLIRTLDLSLDILKRNHLLSVDELYQDIVYPFKLPIAGNESLFDHMHLLAAKEKTSSVDVILTLNGITEIKGKLNLRRADNHYYYTDLEASMGVAGSANLSLPELMGDAKLEYDATENGTDISPAGTNQRSWPDVNFCFPTWENRNTSFNDYYHRTNVNFSLFGFFYLNGPINLWLYLPAALNTICERLGYSADGTFFADKELCTLIVFNNYIVPWSGGTFDIRYAALMPDMSALDFFKALKSVGVTTTIDITERKIYFDSVANVIDNLKTCDVTPYLDRIYEIEASEYNGISQQIGFSDDYGRTVQLGNKNYTADVLINSIDEFATVDYYVYDGTPQAALLRETPGAIFFVLEENSWYTVDDDKQPELIGFESQPYIEDEGEFTLEPIPTAAMVHNIYSQLVPRIDTVVSSGTKLIPFDLKLLFFRGNVRDRNRHSYGFASSDNRYPKTSRPFVVEREDKYSLLPSREHSLAQKLVIPFYKIIAQAKKYTGVLHGDWKLKSRFRSRNLMRVKSTNCIWSEMETTVNDKGKTTTRVEMYKIS